MEHKELLEIIKKNAGKQYNSIPAGFKRFARFIPGVVKEEMSAITGSAGSGKTSFYMQHFIRNPLKVVKEVNDPDVLDVKIFIVTLQKSAKAWRGMMISAMLYVDYGLEIPSRELFSIMEQDDRKLNGDIIAKIEGYNEFFKYFDSKVTIITKKKPTDIAKIVDYWIKGNYQNTQYKDAAGVPTDRYTPFKENLFPVFIIDQLTDVSNDFDPETKQALDPRLSMGLMVTLMERWCNDYGFFCVPVHPQSSDKERVEADFSGKTKMEKVEPSFDGLAVNRMVGGSYNSLIALFVPYVYSIKEHAKFVTDDLKFNYVSLKIIISDFVTRNTRIALWFKGSTGYFEEMPPSDHFKDNLDYTSYIRDQNKKFKRD